MLNSIKRFTALLVIVTLVGMTFAGAAGAAVIGEDNQVTAGKMAADALVVRPLGFVATLVGSVLFVVSLPFSALGGNVEEVGQRLVIDPALFTFKRPVGDL
ncbi:MAG: hypothetical protein QNJ22_03975 [Desulfosarcinaceae bacterium]|nr:hypothetical protein [Desulfosarcinaceae bacterium]